MRQSWQAARGDRRRCGAVRLAPVSRIYVAPAVQPLQSAGDAIEPRTAAAVVAAAGAVVVVVAAAVAMAAAAVAAVAGAAVVVGELPAKLSDRSFSRSCGCQ